MKTIYYIEFDLDERKALIFHLDTRKRDIDSRFFRQNKPLPPDWEWPPFIKEGRRKLPKRDFAYVWGKKTLLLMQETAWQLTNKPLLASGQSWPVTIRETPYHICHPWHEIPAGWKRNESGDFKFWFDPIALTGQYPLFQASDTYVLFTISTPELREQGLDFEYIVRENNLTGLEFHKVWESED